jgi:hypothetical protein
MSKKYDSTKDTKDHIRKVSELIFCLIDELVKRTSIHDHSKLYTPEKEYFDEFTLKLKDSKYGSDEYKKCLSELHIALEHHYAQNRHHPEHFTNGINGFNLVDLIEHFADSLAATKRIKDGNIFESIDINKERFNYPDELVNIFKNTAEEIYGEEKETEEMIED